MCRNVLFSFCLLAVATATVQGQTSTDSPDSSCDNGELRLADGNPPLLDGRVEICFDNEWGTICDDQWDDSDAQVVCRQLGYSAQGARAYGFDASRHKPGTGPIYFDNVDCSGNEEFLFNCSASPIGEHNCNHFEDAGVLCEESGFSCEDGELRLVNGTSMYEGRVELCVNNKFTSICVNEWGDEEASVVCNQLGFTAGGTPYATYGGSFGGGIGQISVSGLNCGGNEINLTACARIPSLIDLFCTHDDDAGVLCPRPDPQCQDGDVRLAGGRINSEGYVEICLNGHWGTVCHSGWDVNDANVLCGELGFTNNGSIPIGSAEFGRGEDLVLFAEFACTGTESNLFSCPKTGVGEHSCSHSQDAGVLCVDPSSTCDGSVRLVGGETENEGRLEICYSNHWGTVCDDNFDATEAALVCRLLGFKEEGSVALQAAFFGEGVGLIFLDDLECIGNETSLFNCSHRGIGSSNCLHNEDVSVLCQAANSACVNGDIRLVNGSGAHSGRVEVCFNGRYGTVCDDFWGADDAAVVCNQLGYPGENAIGLGGAFFGQGIGPIFFDNAECSPLNHTTLISCFDAENDVGVHNCQHTEDASVICPLGNRTCGEYLNGEVRLVGGSTEFEGRVEICLDGEWGTICDNFWTNSDAAVVCRQLELGPTGAQSFGGAFFGQGNGSIHLDKFFCAGDEERITDCLHSPVEPGSCSHSQDVGIVCSASTDSSCDNGELRLADGNPPLLDGRVEICFDNEWGTICDDQWDDRDAQVVCRQLGYSAQGARAYGFDASRHKPGTGPIYFDNVDCSGNEEFLFNCSASPMGEHNCNHFEDAGVLCEEPGFSCVDGELRLVNGTSMYEGRVELCVNNKFTSICVNEWGDEEASVVCNQLGFTAGGTPYATYGGSFGGGIGQISVSGLDCRGNETNLTACARTRSLLLFCTHDDDAGVLCPRPDPQCQDGDVRLAGGRINSEGYVEICLNGHWGTVCHSGWDVNDANVLCGELGFTNKGSIPIGSAEFGRGEDLVLFAEFACTGTESDLFSCPKTGVGEHSCSHSEDAGVLCVDPSSTCDGSVRLVGGETENEGRLEICYSNHWGTVCDDNFGATEAALVCRLLGFEEEGSVALQAAFFGEGVGLIFLDDLECIGNETSLFNCSHRGIGSSNCLHNEDVSVLCQGSLLSASAANSACVNGDIRLVNGSGAHSGRVEVCFNGRYGTVCDDFWGADDAAVVCNQLGYPGENAIGLGGAFFGQGIGPIYFDNAECSPLNHTTLISCFDAENDVGVHNCQHTEDASVICPLGNRTCGEYLNGEVRLVGGSTEFEGRVEICLDGEWGTICDNFWTDNDAAVVCRQLQLEPTGAQSPGGAFFGQGSGSIHLDKFFCAGDEERITDCLHSPVEPGSCSHSQDVGIVCLASPDSSCDNGELRLADGNPPLLDGRVEICFDNEWGTICDDRWDDSNAQVVCRQLGYSAQGARAYGSDASRHKPGTGPIYFDNVDCSGNEEFLFNCSASPIGEHNCNHFEDAGVLCEEPGFSCEDGELRLVNGTSMYEGRVELCVNNKFTSICVNEWGDEEASVVCNQLGFTAGGTPYATYGGSFGGGIGQISVSGLNCGGNEINLTACARIPSLIDVFCTHDDDAGVLCPRPDPQCQDGDVRLAGGRINSEGYVEICLNGHWGTVCHSGWDVNDANVLCGELGFTNNGSIPIGFADFGRGEDLVLFAEFACTGTESNLFSCPKTGVGEHSCSHSEDAGVICVDPSSTCDGSVRLVGGETENEGRLEICYSNHWGTVCDDNFGATEAALVCRLLGFEEEGSIALHAAFFGEGVGLIFLDDLECIGNETSLFNCSHRGIGSSNCLHNEDVSVLCQAANSACVNGDVRLVNGSGAHSGRVEVCFNGRYGTVCDDFWGADDAAVVCNQLGYPGENAIGLGGAFFGQGIGPIFFDNAECSPLNHTTLISCFDAENDIGVHNCDHTEDASVICPLGNRTCGEYLNGEVRLVGGSTEFEGRVEICLDGEWGTICDNFWTNNDAAVVCRQLELGPTDAQSLGGAFFGRGNGSIHLDKFFCAGDEERITDCLHFPVEPGSCSHSQDVGVVCSAKPCVDGEIRLVDGKIPSEGRVELCIDNQFGTVCDDGWDSLDAMVVCRQLGYNDGVEAVALPSAFFGEADSQIFLDDVNCIGNETDLLSCKHQRDTSFCFHFEDAGVLCQSENTIDICINGDLRLVGGNAEYEGNVQVCFNGNWGTVCHDRWDSADARTVCNILGYDGDVLPTRTSYFGIASDAIIFLDEVECIGNETSLLSCPSSVSPGDHDCSHFLDAGVICSVSNASFECETGDLRLVNGDTPNEGRVELCVNGEWGTICDDRWGDNDAAVVCNKLGFGTEGAQSVGQAAFGEGTGRIFMTNLDCEGTETNLFECPYQGPSELCRHSEDAGVTCKPPPCFDGEIRLVNGQVPSEGNVEICQDSQWGTIVCDDGWDNNDAAVVCRQLGYSSEDALSTRGAFFGVESGNFGLTDVGCVGDEGSLLDCSYDSETSFCFSFEVAGVICPSSDTLNCTTGNVRLADGSTEYEGRVELCLHGRWGTICDDSWDSNDAAVVCRQLGYTEEAGNNILGIAVAQKRAIFGQGEGFIILDEVNCNGTESSLLECRARELGVHNCRPTEDASVYCPFPNSPCPNGAVQIVDGDRPDRGRVEFCVGGEWRTICADNYWGNEDAQTVCRQLGFESPENAVAIVAGGGSGLIEVIHLDCAGDESQITDCPVPDFGLISLACGTHDNDAGVICSPDIDNSTCEDGDVRLVEGDSVNEGRVEVCFDRKWGTICDDKFGFEEAVVICRQLNYTNVNASVAIGKGFFGRALAAIHLDELECFGNESSLLECQHPGVGEHNCQHNEDAGVICLAENPLCMHGDIQLVGGDTENEGRLEVCLGGRWGTVCNDLWDSRDATVACRQLGFSDQGAIATDAASSFEVGDGLILLDDLDCTGTEQRLLDCPSAGAGINNCFHNEDVAVICNIPPCTSGDIRLVGGTKPSEGTIEVCMDGRWRTVCSDGWDFMDAAVVCNSLGYEGIGSVAVSFAFFGRGSGDVAISNVECLGNETDLLSCPYTPNLQECDHTADAGVICPPGTPQNCTDGDVRLIGGRNEFEGNVQVCLHGLWGVICPLHTWNSGAASVVCGQLGFVDNGSPISVTNYIDFGFNLNSLFLLQQVVCTGNESSLFQCGSDPFTNGFCDFRDTAGVFCPSVSSACNNGDVRLVDKRNEHSGRVEYCVGGEWLSICGGEFNIWGDRNARAVCRQLGYDNADDAVANFFEVTSPLTVFPYEFFCSGGEEGLYDCAQFNAVFAASECLLDEYAAVICEIPVEECTDGEVRLVDGAAEFEGRVEICLNGRFGTVCDDSWGRAEAQVVCKQLGYSNLEDSIPFSNAYFGQGIVPIHLDELNCTGSESALSECAHSGVGNHNCAHHEDAGVLCISDDASCTHGDLDLVDGPSELEGRLEVCVGGRWGTVCDDGFTSLSAQVVCRQLGYNPDNAVSHGSAFFGPGNGSIFLDELNCVGNESRLLDCSHRGTGVHNCFHSEDVSVVCTELPVTTTPGLGCVEGSVELRGGSVPTEGTVQFCEDGEWGTICDDRWDNAEAEVVCRQLGYEIEGAISVRGAFFGQGEGPIHYRHIICNGSETSLADCPKFNSIIPCGHHEDSGVICPPAEPGNCTTGNVRLADGSTEYEGRVELCLHGRWGTICDDSWDSKDAAVVCRQLGYTENGEPWAAYRADFGAGDGLIILDEVNCNGTEATLLNCRASELGNHNCRPSEDAGVYCPYVGSSCRNGDVRLIGGEFDYEGRPEVCIGGQWGTICSDTNWDDREARTLCRQLGYTNVEDAIAWSNAQYGQGTGPIFLGNLNCTGNEGNILQCESIGGVPFGCDHSDDAGIQCQALNVTLCEDGDIQLVNGVTKNEGRVEICYNNHWGTICDDLWGPNEAAVVCRQLGYGDGNGSIAIRRAYFGEGTGRIHLDNVDCERTTVELDECTHSGVGTHNCGHSEDAGVICIVDNPSCEYGDLRLVGGDSDLEGRVEVCIGGRWGTVCDDLWDQIDASVVCGQLGFSQDEATALSRAFYGQGSGPIFLDQTQCTGNETKLIQCTTSGTAVHNCQHAEDAGVICQPLPCVENSFRLAGGIDDLTGIPQVCVDQKWGSVCANSFNGNAAMLVCGSVGFERTGAQQVPASLFKVSESDTSKTYNLTVTCNNGDCSATPNLDPTCSEAVTGFAGVLCPSKLTAGTQRVCMPGEVRLAGGSISSEGRVEVCLSDQWGTVCDDSWDDRAAAVVCKQLGLPFEGAYAEIEGKYGPGVGPIYLDDVKCLGSEEHILDCKQPPLLSGHNCDHSEDATVVCQGAMPTASGNTQVNTSLSIAVIIPLVVIIIVLILIIIIVIIIVLVYRARKSGKLQFRTFEDERPIVTSESYSGDTLSKEDIQLEEKTEF